MKFIEIGKESSLSMSYGDNDDGGGGGEVEDSDRRLRGRWR